MGHTISAAVVGRGHDRPHDSFLPVPCRSLSKESDLRHEMRVMIRSQHRPSEKPSESSAQDDAARSQ